MKIALIQWSKKHTLTKPRLVRHTICKMRFFSRPYGRGFLGGVISKGVTTGLYVLGLIVITWQGSLPCQAQNTGTGSSDASSANLFPGILPSTNSSAPVITSIDSSAPGAPTTNSAASNTDATPTVLKAMELYNRGQADEALRIINAFLQITPKDKSLDAYILRGAIYAQKQQWSQAESDYKTALQLNANDDGIRYDLADLKFMQKQFDDARSAFVPLQNYHDSDIRDLIKYKIFLCDLLGGHDDAASKELDAFNQVGMNASYYFGNAAWDLVHKKPEDARSWLESSTHIYSLRKHELYLSMLKDLGYLPLPPAAGQ
jgi:Tfp pilus assembly protein PilF